MLKKYIESDYKLMYLDKSRYSLLKKKLLWNNNLTIEKKIKGELYFIFSNVINMDMFVIHRFFLVFWLFTGCNGVVSKYKVHYRLGVYYYHFILKYKLINKVYFKILSFLIDDFMAVKKIDGYHKNLKKKSGALVLYYNNLELLTNYKLARGVYFYRIQHKLFFILYYNTINNKEKWCLDSFLKSIKLNYYINKKK